MPPVHDSWSLAAVTVVALACHHIAQRDFQSLAPFLGKRFLAFAWDRLGQASLASSGGAVHLQAVAGIAAPFAAVACVACTAYTVAAAACGRPGPSGHTASVEAAACIVPASQGQRAALGPFAVPALADQSHLAPLCALGLAFVPVDSVPVVA